MRLRQSWLTGWLLSTRFARGVPARQSSVVGSPDGSDPSPPIVARARLRWVGCPVDQRLHLLGPVGVQAAQAGGEAHALCGRRIRAAALTLRWAHPFCVSCVAAGLAGRWR